MVGIVSYGAYIPRYRIKSEDIARVHGREPNLIRKELLIEEKSVPGFDEDSLTMGVESSLNALKKCSIDKKKIGAIYSGSESKAYAVKPNASIMGAVLNLNHYTSADIEFACKAGTAALQMVVGLVKSQFIEYGIAVGSDTSQSTPGDVLEYTASAGSASFIVGNKKEEVIAELEEMCSVSSDTPDFWRRNLQKYPKHAERFTGVPAYFRHVIACTKLLMKKANVKTDDIDHVAFHTPNGKFPLKAGKILGLSKEKIQSNLIVSKIGNTYSAASLLVLAHILDKARPNERILVTSFGSGAGSDSFLFKVTDNIKKLRKMKKTQDYIDNKEYINYSKYCKFAKII
ncbi:hydroxymethylglutaryl-CoA synthase [Candidatus Woesearchaeota archaeon]|nr:hydroxymethylglutaryl-CoA synthase [Candidatus Woesearchaeota archaeon]|tara:strand:- start:988 stop:2019 length:1032 start_codon:yes stop_codon:yes gene_type:complete